MIPSKYLEIKVFNPNKETHGLFDFENQSVSSEKLTIYKSGCIIKIGDKFEIVLPKQLQFKINDPEYLFVAYVGFNEMEKQFEMQFQCPEVEGQKNLEDRFIIPRTFQQNEGSNQKTYNLQPGDLFKLGKTEFQVVEKRHTDLCVQQCPSYFSKHTVILDDFDLERLYHCKFCLSESKQSIDNPIISGICKCVGNMSYVHLQCMSLWVDQNIEKQETHFGAVLTWTKAFECQVCKEPLPMRITYRNRLYDMFEYERPQIPYLMLEQLNREKECCTQVILIHGWNTEPIKIGRGQSCDIRLNEITVSRQHAMIQVNEQGYWLRDNNSKFGALVMLRDFQQVHGCLNIQTNKHDSLLLAFEQCGFQIGKSIFIFNIKQARLGPQQRQSMLQKVGSNGVPMVYQNSPRLQQKLTKIPQISNQFEEDEPQMDEDSETEQNKIKNSPAIQ